MDRVAQILARARGFKIKVRYTDSGDRVFFQTFINAVARMVRIPRYEKDNMTNSIFANGIEIPFSHALADRILEKEANFAMEDFVAVYNETLENAKKESNQ